MKLRCRLIAGSDVEHLHQIYAGFAMLHRAGEIELTQEITPASLDDKHLPGRWDDYRSFNTTVVVNDSLRITYDTHDWAWIDPEILAASDLYFKRSFSRSELDRIDGANKVHPLGLNMQVNDTARDMFRLRRSRMYGGSHRLKTVLKSLRVDSLLGTPEVERLDNFEHEPQPDVEPRILYMARMWDPKSIESKKQSEAVQEMNASRADAIRTLRKEFGDRFFGGVASDEHSRRKFPDVVIDDSSLTHKRGYLAMLQKYPICVATVGLNGSNGWKLAEYVAASKAIISEPLVYEVPGDFKAGTNYLVFANAEELLHSAHTLIDDRHSLAKMMEANRAYYTQHVRPDAMIRNSLTIASELLAG